MPSSFLLSDTTAAVYHWCPCLEIPGCDARALLPFRTSFADGLPASSSQFFLCPTLRAVID